MFPVGISYALILAGITILLYGLEESNWAFRRSLGSRGRGLLSRLGNRKSSAFSLGVILSAIAQSGSAATAFAVGLVDIHALPYEGAILVMMGASVGSTLLVPLLAIDIDVMAPIFLMGGFVLCHLKKEDFRKIGWVVRGIALILTGMFLLKLGSSIALEGSPIGFFIARLVARPFWLGVTAFFLSAITQGASGVMAIGIALISAGVASAEAFFPLVLGARLGSSIIVLFFSVGTRPNARRLAWLSFVYRCLGVAAGYLCMPLILQGTSFFIPVPEMKLAVYQIGVSILNVLIFSPFVRQSALVSGRWFSEEEAWDPEEAMYLDDSLTDFPSLAVPLLAKEMTRLANYVETFIYMLFFAPHYKDQILKLQRGIPALLQQCSDYMFAIPVPLDDPEQKTSYSSISYSLIAMADLVEITTGRLYKLWRNGAGEGCARNIEEKMWKEYVQSFMGVVRYSMRAFALDDEESVHKALRVEKIFKNYDQQIRQALIIQGRLFVDRKDSLDWGLLTVLRVAVSAALEVAWGGRFRGMKLHLGGSDDIVPQKKTGKI
ncbi:Na/Pi cotransporter family protein [Aminobacterium mobile]|uniref:Na/Pi cotransporter family protein n=1 Tax=Aminobacterium mobile TaxID=81467 RepID=UPI0033149ED8